MNEAQKNEMVRIKQALLDQKSSRWLNRFDERQRRLIANARQYADADPAGLPGHQLMLIISKLSDLLDAYE